jgi:ADP-ribose pyrophosphatase
MEFDTRKEQEALREVRTGSEEIFSGVVLHVQRDTARLPNGAETIRELIRHIGAVCVIPVLENGDVIMERQYRYPLDQVILEIPAGKLDAKNEDRFSAIQRELREETGYESDAWTHLLTIPSQATLSDNIAWLFRAENCRLAASQKLDEMELLDVQKYSPNEIEEMIFSGRFQQAVHVAAWLLARRQ